MLRLIGGADKEEADDATAYHAEFRLGLQRLNAPLACERPYECAPDSGPMSTQD